MQVPGFYCACDTGTSMSHDKTACLRSGRKGSSSRGSDDGSAVTDSSAEPKLQKAVSLAIARGGQSKRGCVKGFLRILNLYRDK